MFIPLVDVLRCVKPHAETWLVASIERAEDRYIIEGTLGCPTCLAEYPIHAAVVHFSTTAAPAAARPPAEADAVRLAAALDLTDARMTAVLVGMWGAHAQLVVGVSPAQLLLLNPPAETTGGDGISVLRSAIAPLAGASVNAIALDALPSDDLMASLRRSLRAGGRLLAPAGMALPAGFTELARDAEVWVARLDDAATVSAPVPLTRRSPRER